MYYYFTESKYLKNKTMENKKKLKYYGGANVYVTNNWMVDHTSVAITMNSGLIAGYGCSGDIGTLGARSLFTDLRMDTRFATLIASFDYISDDHRIFDRNFYSRTGTIGYKNCAFPNWGDCCGLKYGYQGVCHTMANRILSASNNPLLVVNGPNGGILESKSGALSFSMYGYYGKGGMTPSDTGTTLNWAQYFAICEEFRLEAGENVTPENFIVSLSADDRVKITNDYIEMFRRRLNSNEYSGDDFYKKIMLHELDNIDSEDLSMYRFEMLLNEAFGENSDVDTKAIIEAYQKLDAVVKNANKLEQSRDEDDYESYVGSLNDINNAVRIFSKRCFEVLGAEKYELLLVEKFNENEDFLSTK